MKRTTILGTLFLLLGLFLTGMCLGYALPEQSFWDSGSPEVLLTLIILSIILYWIFGTILINNPQIIEAPDQSETCEDQSKQVLLGILFFITLLFSGICFAYAISGVVHFQHNVFELLTLIISILNWIIFLIFPLLSLREYLCSGCYSACCSGFLSVIVPRFSAERRIHPAPVEEVYLEPSIEVVQVYT